MFQVNWAQTPDHLPQKIPSLYTSPFDKKEIDVYLHLVWEEHCIECAVPDCYKTCPLYQRRSDGDCARFVYGIFPNKMWKGLYDFGADIQFRKWGKLECRLKDAFPLKIGHKRLVNIYDRCPPVFRNVLQKFYDRLFKRKGFVFDEFILECYSPSEDVFKLMLEHFTEQNGSRTVLYKQVFKIVPGFNTFKLPASAFQLSDGYIYIHPENSETERRLIFTWLDFVKYKKRKAATDLLTKENLKKIKCIAWDLDNTLWKGTLAESNEIVVEKKAVKLINELDRKGIIQTVISKNDFQRAWDKLKEFGLQDFFLYPQINWTQKSINLKHVADQLNIGVDSIGMIDDSPFERDEVRNSLPQVRVYSNTQIEELLNLEEFNVPVTSVSVNRRKSYMIEAQRQKERAGFSGSYDDFLAGCDMQLEIFLVSNKPDIVRCWELVQRSNQLNLSDHRYSLEEFFELIGSLKILPLGLKCKDKYGDYGIIGFANIHFPDNFPVLINFAISCRVAQKKIEHHFIQAAANFFYTRGFDKFNVELCHTKKNGPLQQVFGDLPFVPVRKENNVSCLSVNLTNELMITRLMKIEFDKDIEIFYNLNLAGLMTV